MSIALSLVGCKGQDGLPGPDSAEYVEVVSLHNSAVARIEVGEDKGAMELLQEVTVIAPGEPSAWYNMGLLAARRNELDLASQYLDEALSRAPEDYRIHLLLGFLKRLDGQTEESIASLRRAVDLNPESPKAAFALATELDQSGVDTLKGEANQLLDGILLLQSDNAALLTAKARMAVENNDPERLRDAVSQLQARSGRWPADVRDQLQNLQAAAEASDLAQARNWMMRFNNLLKPLEDYRGGLEAIQTSPELVADVMAEFVRLPMPSYRPALPDTALTFLAQTVSIGEESWDWLGTFYPSSEAPPNVILANGRTLHVDRDVQLPWPGGDREAPPSLHGVLPIDYDYDFRMDLVLAGEGGMRLFRQEENGSFIDATAQSGLAASIINGRYHGAWAVDLDLEGDMDILLATKTGPPVALRNNGDGSFRLLDLFDSIRQLRDLVWADLDLDGDPDPVFLDAEGSVQVVRNERSVLYVPDTLPAEIDRALAISAADIDRDGVIDLLVLRPDGSIVSVTTLADAEWKVKELLDVKDLVADADPAEFAHVVPADLDNNVALDLVVSVSHRTGVWLGDSDFNFLFATPLWDVKTLAIDDVRGTGSLDLLALSSEREPVHMVNQSTTDYFATSVRPRAAVALGDQRINTFALGGEIEVRSGLLYQKQPIVSPAVHFGLGDHAVVDVARIIWPNGDTQAEFDLESDQMVLARQRMKGSCPWVFTFDGTEMTFVTDFIWRSPLGLRINAVETAGILATEDWVKIRRDQLVESDGFYDVRITAELWETHFFDHVSLMAVDHPAETEIFINESFSIPPPEFSVFHTERPKPIAQAWDDTGRDVTDIVRARDEQYLDGFEPGQYQGRATDHYVEVDLGTDAPSRGPLFLLAFGWVRPTDSSINVAISQGDNPPPKGVRVDVLGDDGTWHTVHSNLGFPSGKLKTMVMDLAGVFEESGPRRIRLHTNLEVYWDDITWAVGLSDSSLVTRRIPAHVADLRHRGFSRVDEPTRAHPEVPVYADLESTRQMWRDLVGFYTRFGDVRELLAEVDDRYVIMNAADEMAFLFPAPPPPESGWVRDFVLIGDGWVKDGDYNTTFGKTVRPLPDHQRADLTEPPGLLHDDPVYRRFPEDWDTYHTRYVNAADFGLKLAGRPPNKSP